jgi:hypothetical protein
VCLHSEEIKGDHAYKTRYSNEVEMIVAQEYLYETQPTVESYELADASLPKFDQARFYLQETRRIPLQTPGDGATAAMRMLKYLGVS